MDVFRAKVIAVTAVTVIVPFIVGRVIAVATYVPIWIALIVSAAICVAGAAKYRSETQTITQRAEDTKRAEANSKARQEREAQDRRTQQDAELKHEQEKRSLKRLVDQLLGDVEDLEAGATRDKVVSVMGESVAKLEPFGSRLALPENQRVVEDLQLVLSRLSDANLSNTIAATRLRRLVGEVSKS